MRQGACLYRCFIPLSEQLSEQDELTDPEAKLKTSHQGCLTSRLCDPRQVT